MIWGIDLKKSIRRMIKIGGIHQETLAQGRGVHEFDNMNLTDENILKNLILNRREIDKYMDIRTANNYDCFEAGELPLFYEIIDIMYIDLDNLISKTHLTDKQSKLIKQLMYGYTLNDISELNEEDYGNLIRTFATAIKRLKQQAEQEWEFGLQWDRVKTKSNWKKCSKCNEWYPVNEKYYKYDITNKRFKSRCRRCEG